MSLFERVRSIFCKKNPTNSGCQTQDKKAPTKNYVFESVFPSKEVQDEVLRVLRNEEN